MTREQLKGIRLADQRINSKLDKIEQLRSLAERTTTLMTGMPRCVGDQDKYNAIICRIWALEKEIDADIDAFAEMHRAASDAIDALENERERIVLEMRYLCYRSWGRIAREMEIPERTVYWLHGQALKHILTLQ